MSLSLLRVLRNPGVLLLLAASLAVATPAARAAHDRPDDGEVAGRIADLDGRLRLDRANGESFDLGEGQRLRPSAVREGDRLHTGWNSRLVIEVGPNRVKLDERTELVVRRLDFEGVALDLVRGSVVLDLRQPENAWRWQVDSAAGRHQPHGAGLFRIDAPDRRRGFESGSATAWRSALRIENDEGTLLLPPGQRAERDRDGRWQLAYPVADAFAAWAMDTAEPGGPDLRDERRPRHWQAAPSWEVRPPPPAPPPPPRVIVVPPPVVIEPPPRHWRVQPEPREREQRPLLPPMPAPMPAPVTPTRPMPVPDIAAPPRRFDSPPERQHHDAAPRPPMAPSSPAMPRPDEPRRPQRAL